MYSYEKDKKFGDTENEGERNERLEEERKCGEISLIQKAEKERGGKTRKTASAGER